MLLLFKELITFWICDIKLNPLLLPLFWFKLLFWLLKLPPLIILFFWLLLKLLVVKSVAYPWLWEELENQKLPKLPTPLLLFSSKSLNW